MYEDKLLCACASNASPASAPSRSSRRAAATTWQAPTIESWTWRARMRAHRVHYVETRQDRQSCTRWTTHHLVADGDG